MKKNIFISILCLAAILLCCLSAVSAEDMNADSVINTTENVDADDELSVDEDNEILAETGTFTDLQAEIDRIGNNGHIYLDKDYVYTDGDSPIVLNKIVNIHGNGKTIDGANKVTIFTTSKRIILDNITFINGKGENGGALSITSNPKSSKITNCKFYNNTASKEGGAIYSTQEKITISNCEFRENSANKAAGAIKLTSKPDSTISFCEFYDNTANNAGAIDIRGSENIIITNCSFYRNNATESGAIYAGSKNLQILNSSFYNNTAEDRGGAVFVGITGVTISKCEFYDNQVKYVVHGSPTNIGGGAIYLSTSDKTITDSKFENNKASFSYGGAIYCGGGTLGIVGCEFVNNTGNTIRDQNGDMGGGAIHFKGTKCEISNSKFTDNSAFSGSAIYLREGNLDIVDSSFLRNFANVSSLVITREMVNNHEASFTAKLYGNDNIINAIWNNNKSNPVDKISFKNVTYFGVNGEMNTGNQKVICVEGYANSDNSANPYQDKLISKFEVILELYKGNDLIKSVTGMTDINGEVRALNIKLTPGGYTLKARHERDDYYEFIENHKDFNIPKYQTTVIETNVSEKAFRSIDIAVDILDEDNNKVQNGTAKMSFNNEDYTATVSNGKAIFTGVKLPEPGNYSTTVYYRDVADYYIDSQGTLNIEVLKLNTKTSLQNISGVSGETVDVEVSVIDEDGNPVKSGTVELIIYYDSSSSLGSSQTIILKVANDSQNSDVNDGKAKFSVTLQKPGNYVSEAKYLGNTVYNPSADEGNVNISKINTTTNQKDGAKIIDSIKEFAGTVRDITVDVLTDDGTPVKNGTAIMKINGKSYTADVVDGKATFKNVEMPDNNTVAEIYYQGNDWYNPSNSTIDIIIEHKDEPQEDEDEPQEDSDDSQSEDDSTSKSNSTSELKSDSISKSVSSNISTQSTGNPIFVLVLVLISLVCNSIRRRK